MVTRRKRAYLGPGVADVTDRAGAPLMAPDDTGHAMPRPDDVVFPRRRERFEDRRKEGDQRKLLDQFFDHSTLLAVSRLITRGAFDQIDHPISVGKEGGVFRATKGPDLRAIKIYRISNSTFRHLPPYALDALRREASARNFGGLIFAWTRREHTILGRLREAGVPVPVPFVHFRNVLVMEFIGNADGAAGRLKDAVVDDPNALYGQLVAAIGGMVRKAGLVHGDLSPYNTLYFDGRPVIIDVAQSVPTDHPQAKELLRRDIDHYARFLERLGADVDAHEFFRAVGGETLGPVPAEAR